jgi:hypothetical protein
MKTDFKEIWLEQEISAASNTIRQKAIELGSTVCYVGRIGASNAKMFQIEIGNNVLINQNYLKRFHGVEIRVLEGLGSKKDITIILSDNDLLDVFVLFLEDLMRAIEVIKEEGELPLIINQKVNYWGKLFAKIKGSLLSLERQRGLFGELTFLNILLNRSSDHIKSVVSWTGPEGANQDFSNELSATEVKTSKATKPTVNIANELQLDWTVFNSLFLCVFHVDELSNGDQTLEGIIEEIKTRISNQPELISLFEGKLDRVGIPYGEEQYYNEIGFIIRSQRVYRVQDGFPVLTNNTIGNDAVHNVSYQIDIAACEKFEVNIDDVINKMI